ncbi:hypothetical protein JR316_0004005 [Psilocybe cubensis]|uniref:Uncharacterized protein n=1 Tax=Psilocybe cubensis TaxID=181762 RepID=A0ACB8H9C1_PSICU|nr:hypothetical protein JR316_0004005 [Psilocybe cubensis]KAH9484523.1 hypothetical protein JR316_0004005 [Psilocybe cubensis]
MALDEGNTEIMHMQQDQPPKVGLTIDPAQDFCPPDMVPIHPPPESTDILSVQVPPGTVFSSKGVDVFRRSSTPLDVTFTVKAREAAVLILQNGGLREDLISTVSIRDYVQKHALKWYMFVNQFGPGNIICPNGSLYLVTGCDKANSWASACYPLDYKQVGRVAAICRFQESMSNPWEDSINMECRIAINVSQWAEHLLRNRPPEYISFYNVLIIPVVGIPARFQSFLEKRLKHPESYTSEPTELLFHPLEIILRFLIEEFPQSDVAIIEDYLWTSVTNPEARTRLLLSIVYLSLTLIKADSDTISISRLLIKILELNVVASQNGWVTLAPPPAETSKKTSSRSIFLAIPTLIQNKYLRYQKRRCIARKISRIFPGPPIPVEQLQNKP